jgi:N-acetylmuramoyl-L-alanine amidase-like protein
VITPLLLAAVGLLLAGLWLLTHQPKTDIRAEEGAVEDFSAGRVTEGANSDIKELKTESKLSYESAEHETKSPTTNAVGIQWEQSGRDAEDANTVELRTFDGKSWSNWIQLEGTDDRKDNAPAIHSGILITENAKKAQYRFKLNGNGQAVAIKNPRLVTIDATRGPNPTKPNPLAKLFGGKAKARADGPRIFNRGEWGCPEATSSPRWPPEYVDIDEVIIHHTAAVNYGGDTAAAVRSIWYFHANSNGWGDIGYNYVVDIYGNIFQGRYYDWNYARDHHKEVVGGHTLNGHNFHSSGIAALGNFSEQGVPGSLINGLGTIAGWKTTPWGFDPALAGRLIGHRDADSTACPGTYLYGNLNGVRSVGSSYYNFYRKWDAFDHSFSASFVNGSPSNAVTLRTGQTATFALDLKNEGTSTWSNAGGNPVRIGTDRPLDHSSGFASGWLSPSRPTSFANKVTVNGDGSRTLTPSSTIAPGEIGRFQFDILATPTFASTLREHFRPVSENYTWFVRDLGIYFDITTVPDTYTYQWISQTYNVPTTPDTTASMSLTVKNTGNVNWSSTGSYPTRLGTSNPLNRNSGLYHSSWISNNRPATFAGRVEANDSVTPTTTIAPGEKARFNFTVKTPNQPYVANEHFNLLVENYTWMNDVGLYWPVNIGQNYHVQWDGQSGFPTIVKSTNPVGTLYFDFKNTGTYAWNKNGVVKLGTSNPLDRPSGFYASNLGTSGNPALPADTQNWLAPGRPGTFVGKVTGGVLDNSATVINPGETARFKIPLDARSVSPGVYREYFRMVAEGWVWLEDPGAFIDVTVQP